MWPWYTADDKRSAAAIIALIVAMIITVELLILVAGGMVTILLTGGGLTTPPPGQWPGLIAGVLSSPADPAAVFGVEFPGLAVLGCHHPARHRRPWRQASGWAGCSTG